MSPSSERQPRAPTGVSVGAAFLASANGAELAPGGRVELGLARARSTLGASAGLFVVGTHAFGVGAGRGAWRRFGVDFDLRRRVSWSRVRVEGGLGVSASVVAIEGRAFVTNAADSLLDPGALGRLRLVAKPGRAQPWLELAGAFWPRVHVLSVTGTNDSREMPRFEAFLSLGASIDRVR